MFTLPSELLVVSSYTLLSYQKPCDLTKRSALPLFPLLLPLQDAQK